MYTKVVSNGGKDCIFLLINGKAQLVDREYLTLPEAERKRLEGDDEYAINSSPHLLRKKEEFVELF